MNTYKFKLNNYKYKYWHLNDEIHRDNDRPAWIGTDGNKGWYQHGEYHRDNDKPARIWPNGDMQYWVNDKWIKQILPSPKGKGFL